MRRIVLEPVRDEAPSCEAFADVESVKRFERAVRAHRARVEPFTVAPLDGRADGAYRVTGASHNEYLVDIVDAGGRRDTCTCPDFFSNELGVCKHIEAVRRAIGARTSLRREYARLGTEPLEPVLTVSASGTLRLIAAGPWPDALRARYASALRSPPAELARPQLVAGRLPEGPRIVHAAPAAFERLLVNARRARRRKTLDDAVQAGRIHPEALELPLFPYQRDGVIHLVRRGRALLADDMGLGKTIQAIAACEMLRLRGEARRILVVTTATLKHQWAQEIERWAGEPAMIVGGSARARSEAMQAEATYTILNYELTWRELSRLRDRSPDVLILDEAQRAKNFRTKTASTLREIPSRFLFILTGTPLENRLDDLYSLMQLIDPAIFGPLWRFNVDFHQQSESGKIIGYKNLAKLRARTAPIVLRRAKEAVLQDLPELTQQTRYTPLTKEQIELEESYRAQAARLLAIAERRPLSKQEQERLMMYLLKARQACNALELCDPSQKRRASPKLDEFEALLEEIAAQGTSKVLVFSEWVKMLELAAERLDRLGIGHTMLHGGVPTERRPALLDRFRSDPRVRVLLSTDAGGVGLNLQEASYVVHLDLPWNPARLDQRTGRSHRLGQKRGVLVTCLCAEQGIERGIEGTLGQKRAVRAAALDPNATDDVLEAPSFSVFLRQTQEVLAALEAHGPAPGIEGGSDAEDAAGAGAAVVDAAVVGAAAFGEAPAQAVSEPASPTEPEASAEAVTSAEPVSQAEPAASAEPVSQAEPAAAAEPAAITEPVKPVVPLLQPHPALPAEVAPAHAQQQLATAARASARAVDRLRLAHVVLDAGFPNDAARAAYEAVAAAIRDLAGSSAPTDHAGLVASIYRELLPAGRVPPGIHAVLARLHDLSALHAAGIELPVALAEEAIAEASAMVDKVRSTELAPPPETSRQAA
jgi:superfamily II DNA or RNA helicase